MTSATYQYVSEAMFAAKRTAGKGGKGERWSTLDVVGEALRWSDGHYLAHFTNRGLQPVAPIFVAGMTDPAKIMRWHDRLVSVALAPAKDRPRMKTARGEEAQRCNSPVLLSIVASYPEPGLLSEADIMQLELSERERYIRELISKRQQETLQSPEFIAWRDATLQWAKDRYGEHRLRVAVVHYDESHIHTHMVFDNEGRTVKPMSLHAAEPPRSESTPAQRKAAYKQAGSEMQDNYHAAVAQPLGIGRISPTPRGRLSSAERKAAKARKRAQDAADEIIRQAHEESRLMREAALREAEAAHRTAVERARRDVEAAYAQAEADLTRHRDQQIAALERELQTIREAERARLMVETREQMREALTLLRRRESNWARLMEQVVPDEEERTRMMAAVGLIKSRPTGLGAAKPA